MMKTLAGIVAIVTAIGLNGCNHASPSDDKKVVARVYDKYLYQEDLAEVIPNGLSVSDSARKAQNYINMWAKTELLLKKAELNLTAEQKNVQKQLEDYRASLIIYTYKQKFIEQKLDTSITKEDIEEYYNSFAEQFRLTNEVVKALFIKLPKDVPDLYKIQYWYRSASERDSFELAEYCLKYADKYDFFGSEWVPFKEIASKIPVNIPDAHTFLSYNSFIEAQDSSFNYYLRIYDFRLKGDISPLIFVESNVRSILLNKKKIELVNELENNIYREALNYKNLELYD